MNTEQSTAGEQLLKQASDLADLITERQYKLQPELTERFGASGRMRTKQDTLYSLNYLAESVVMNSPVLFIVYVSWLRVLLAGYNVSDDDIKVNFEVLREAIIEHFDHPDKKQVLDHLEMGMAEPAKPAPSFISYDQPLGKEAEVYLKALLDGERRQASDLIHRLLDEGTPVKSLYKYIFQQVQYEIGRLWLNRTISVAQEHYCTAVTQSIISSLYPRWVDRGTKGLRMVAACVGSEMHEIGLRMVADTFEMEGWDTYYLGANVPDQSLVKAIVDHEAHVIAISATMTFHVHLVRDLIKGIKSSPSVNAVKIIVGGLPFNLDPHLWREVGADGHAADAESALALAEQLVTPVFKN